jgi:ATP-dependent helicase Lhr and Lhr-like helicase
VTDAEPAAGPLGALHPTLGYHLVNTLGWTSLRPLQRDALGPVLRGDDALLLAPTAGARPRRPPSRC